MGTGLTAKSLPPIGRSTADRNSDLQARVRNFDLPAFSGVGRVTQTRDLAHPLMHTPVAALPKEPLPWPALPELDQAIVKFRGEYPEPNYFDQLAHRRREP